MELAFGYVMEALAVLFTIEGILCLVLSVFLGLLFGMLPGLTATMGVALLTGVTYSFDGPLAVLVLIGVYIGAISGGSQSAVLLNIPGTPASAATAMEGYPMALQGKGNLAIFIANAASATGTIVSIICVAIFTPMLTNLALQFNSHEMFLLTVFGIVICGNLTSGGDPLKGWISGFVGLLLSQVGLDTINAMQRFCFGNVNLTGGITLLPVMIGLFGFPEIVNSFNPQRRDVIQIKKFKAKEGLSILGKNKLNLIRSSMLGVCMGVIPGVGEDTGGWLSYWAEKKTHPELKWNQGEPNGVISAEAGNNAAVGGALIPVLSLAIPGSTSAAVLLAAFWMHGYRPGPLMMQDTPEFLYYLIVFMLFATVTMWLIASNMARITVRVLRMDNRVLMPVIFICCVIGAFVVSNRLFDIYLMFIFGLLGIAMSKMRYPCAPFLLGIILGNMGDENLRRALILHKGDISPFFTRPISIFFILFILVIVLPQIPACRKLWAKIVAKKHQD